MLVGESRVLDYGVPHNYPSQTCEIQPTICSKSLVNYKTSGSDQTGDHNRPKLVLSYQLSPFIKRSGEKFLFQHGA